MKALNSSAHTRLTGALRWLMLITCLVIDGFATQAVGELENATPPPVSGRRLSNPESILSADVLARVELLRENVELLRIHMGKPTPPMPLLRVESAQPFECDSQARSLQLRANRLAFEQIRVVGERATPSRADSQPSDIFTVTDSALAAVLLVKHSLGIEQAVAEKLRPDTTTPSEVFNATVAAGSEINHLLDKRTSPSDVFQLVTTAVHTAAALHSVIGDGPPFPEEPAFEPNKSPSDVYIRMLHCLSLTRQVSGTHGMPMLEFDVTEQGAERVTPNDVGDLASLVAEELLHVHRRVSEAPTPIRAHYPGRRFPAHVYQRVGLLERILEDLIEASGTPVAEPNTSKSDSGRS